MLDGALSRPGGSKTRLHTVRGALRFFERLSSQFPLGGLLSSQIGLGGFGVQVFGEFGVVPVGQLAADSAAHRGPQGHPARHAAKARSRAQDLDSLLQIYRADVMANVFRLTYWEQ